MSYNPKYNSTYSLKIPSIEKRIEYREYTVGEEKEIILIDKEESQAKKFYKIKILVKKCLLTDIDFEKISPSELLYIFINMRIRSVGDESIALVPCPKCLESLDDDLIEVNQLEELKLSEKDQTILLDINKKITSLNTSIRKKYEQLQNEVKIDLNKIKIAENKDHTKLIKLTDTLTLEMKYGINSTDILDRDVDTKNKSDEELIIQQTDADIEILAYCIDTIYDGDETITGLSIKEKIDILKDMPSKFRKKLEKFLETQPTIEYKDKTTCKLCGNEFDYNLTSINDFF
jgi:hypothetical protein